MKNVKQPRPFALFLSGPTASGKTALSIKISESLPVEIVNTDLGQFYKPLSVGTAKPDWENQVVPHHLFDILDNPVDFDVIQYRKVLLDKIKEISSRGKIPLIVGGSLFYVKSVLYPPFDYGDFVDSVGSFDDDKNLWERLFEIDPERAKKIHKNDLYRIRRALLIWKQTGKKPSEFEPKFSAPFDFVFMFLWPELSVLREIINERTIEMLSQDGPSGGWVEECRGLLGTPWQKFICRKKMIGYPEIFNWIIDGEDASKFDALVERIQISTSNYAKRQITFWKQLEKKLKKECSQSSCNCRTITINNDRKSVIEEIVMCINESNDDSKREHK